MVNGDVISTNISRVLLTADDCATREEKYDSLNKQIMGWAPLPVELDRVRRSWLFNYNEKSCLIEL